MGRYIQIGLFQVYEPDDYDDEVEYHVTNLLRVPETLGSSGGRVTPGRVKWLRDFILDNCTSGELRQEVIERYEQRQRDADRSRR